MENAVVEITINESTQSAEHWLLQLEEVLQPPWFAVIAGYLRSNGVEIEEYQAKKKACYIRCFRTAPAPNASYWQKRYIREFSEDVPDVDGKDWRLLA